MSSKEKTPSKARPERPKKERPASESPEDDARPKEEKSTSGGAPTAGGKDIFALALSMKEKEKKENPEEERTVIFAGSKNSGKSSLILRFLDREQDQPKPTTALEYTYGRKSRNNDMGKDIAHIWELGGGTFLANLIETPITPLSLKSLSFLLVLDLSRPETLWYTVETLLQTIRQKLDRVMSELTQRESKLPQYLTKKAWARFPPDTPEKDFLSPFPVPLCIMGSKYDLFQDFDPEKKKILCKALRFIAHTNGASLVFVSDKDEALVNRARSMMAHLAFKTALAPRPPATDHTKPICVYAGSDSLEKIGAPPLIAAPKTAAKTPLDMWRQAYGSVFPPDTEAQKSNKDLPDDPCANAAHSEEAVDSMRAQKNEELVRYRKQAERRARDKTAADGAASASLDDTIKSARSTRDK